MAILKDQNVAGCSRSLFFLFFLKFTSSIVLSRVVEVVLASVLGGLLRHDQGLN